MIEGEQAMAEVDVVVAGGGPGGLSAALVLGRARKRVVLCDGGERRNQLAEHLHNFVTRDGTKPEEFRRFGREELSRYGVALRRERVRTIAQKEGGGFGVTLESGSEVFAKHVVLATGVIDEPMELPGMREAWGHSVFQCPFCHGWEVRDQVWGVLLPSAELAGFAQMLTGWSPRVIAFTHGAFEVPTELQRQLADSGVQLETGVIRRLVVEPGGKLRAIESINGGVTPVEVLFTKPKQHLPEVVRALGLEIDPLGYVRVNDRQETSIPGVFAVGDLTTPMQAALLAAAAGMTAAATIVHALNVRGKLEHE